MTKVMIEDYKTVDADGDGQVSKEEFWPSSLLQVKSKLSSRGPTDETETDEKDSAYGFAAIDKDGDGFLSAEELTSDAKDHPIEEGLEETDEEITESVTQFLKEVDDDGDGKVSEE